MNMIMRISYDADCEHAVQFPIDLSAPFYPPAVDAHSLSLFTFWKIFYFLSGGVYF